MNSPSTSIRSLPPEQQAVRDKCFHPSGVFVPFEHEDIEQSIPARFEKIAAKYSERTAVRAEDQTLTYDVLNRMANRVAWAILAERGNAAEPIALLAEHGAAAIVAVLGALKAGKFYVPLDPSHPAARTRYILEDTQARFIVTNSRNLRLATELAQNGCRLLNMDELDSSLSPENPDSLAAPPDGYAYILYTSGSTGQPKGVIQNHRNLLHKSMTNTNFLRICTADRLTLLHSYGFTASLDNLFGALLNGACLFPFSVKEAGVSELANWLNLEEITIYHSVPSVFRHLIDTLTVNEGFPKIRVCRLGGEQVTSREVELYKQWFSPECIFLNALGSNETGPIRRYFIDKSTEIPEGRVPAGYAIREKEVLLLDDDRNEVGCNQVGEIAVRSRYLALGYWRSPELTRAKFLPDPEGGDKRIYLTGDLGRVLPDGCLMHLGRKDFQVKIRGQRVEIAEVESALLEHDGVKEVAVLASASRPGEERLIAYFVPSGRAAPRASELRSFLGNKLPDYMIPSVFKALEALPLAPSGKVDRKALPDPDDLSLEREEDHVAPRTAMERLIAEVWQEVLGVDRVGAQDNFFDLGADSLLSAKAITGVERKTGQRIDPREMTYQTLGQLAAACEQRRSSEQASLLKEFRKSFLGRIKRVFAPFSMIGK